jgi:hypothetical protein
MKDTTHPHIDDLIARVRGEYLEMPGLRLTCGQASRLWAVDSQTCQQLLRRLMDARFLRCTPDGSYSRADA